MSYFEKFEKFSMTSGVKFFKHGFIFEVRAKSSCQNLWIYILVISMWGLVSYLKNKAVFEKFNATWSSHHYELEQCKFASSKSANFWQFLMVFLIFGVLFLSFGTSVIYAWKGLTMSIHMTPSPSFYDVLESVQIFVTAVRLKCYL